MDNMTDNNHGVPSMNDGANLQPEAGQSPEATETESPIDSEVNERIYPTTLDVISPLTKVLDDGYVELVDMMPHFSHLTTGQIYPRLHSNGLTMAEIAVVEAARTSTNQAAKSHKEDVQLLKYLIANRHTTPLEMVEFKFKIRIPMDAWRQMIRHRTACLAGSTKVLLVTPDDESSEVSIEELYRDYSANPTDFKRYTLALSAQQRLERTRIKEVMQSGAKVVYRVTLINGRTITMSEDHLCLVAVPGGDVAEKPLRHIVQLPSSKIPAWSFTNPGITQLATYDKKNHQWAISLITDVQNAGEIMTYDLEVVHPNHNFVAELVFVHNSVNEYSTRYVEAIDSVYQPEALRSQGTFNRQGSTGNIEEWPDDWELWMDMPIPRELIGEDNDFLGKWPDDWEYVPAQDCGDVAVRRKGDVTIVVYSIATTPDERFGWGELTYRKGINSIPVNGPSESPYMAVMNLRNNSELYAQEVYKSQVALGVARELARSDLPLGTYTEAFWKIDLHNLLHYLGLRMHEHAQLEIRQYANTIAEYVKAMCPTIWKLWYDHAFAAVSLSGTDQAWLMVLISRGTLTRPADVSANDFKRFHTKIIRFGQFDLDGDTISHRFQHQRVEYLGQPASYPLPQ